MNSLPRRQQLIFDYLREHQQRFGAPPTFREVAAHFGLTISTVQESVAALERKGFLARTPGKARGLHIAETLASASRTIPILGLTTAGQPALAIEHIEGHLVIDTSLFPETEVFALRVSGESMIDAGIHDGDFAIIRRQNEVAVGEIALVLVDREEATIKKVYRAKQQVELRPANPEMKSLFLQADRVRIQGKVIGIYRKIE
jgi:repressor LexA